MAARTKTRIDPDAMYQAWQGAVAEIDGVEVTVKAGERRRGSDPIVQRLGLGVFGIDGEPAPGSVFDRAIAADEAAAVKAPPPPRRASARTHGWWTCSSPLTR
jgi:hypothetical protein